MFKDLKKLKSLVTRLSRDLTLLIVDDEEVIRELCKASFGNSFALCDTASNGEIAYEMWSRSPKKYDLIISDINMPVMTGLELLAKIRETSLEQSFIALTANTELSTNQDIAYHHVDAILAKPLQEELLFPLLYRVLTKISDHKDIHLYLDQLEHYSHDYIAYQLGIKRIIKEIKRGNLKDYDLIAKNLEQIIAPHESALLSSSQEKSHTNDQKKQQNEDLRVDIEEIQMSSLELSEILDDSTIDKLEDIFKLIDSLYLHLDRLLESDSLILNTSDLQLIAHSLHSFANILENIGLFTLIVRTFFNLSEFVLQLNESDLQSSEKNRLFVEMFTFLINDIKNWITTVFITKEAKNIYYFDASFVSNCLNITAIFQDDESYDDEGMEFF